MNRNRSSRYGFTLIELMVVLVILGILIALTVAVVGKYIGVSQSSATEVTIRKVYSRFQSMRAAVMKTAQSEDMLKTVGSTALAQIQTAAGTDADAPRRGRVIYVKLRLMQEFPMTFAEARSPGPLAGKQAYVSAFPTSLGGVDAVTGADYQSAACLLLALQQGRAGSTISADDYGPTSVKTFTDKTSGAIVRGFADAWGSPLAYYRWPTGSVEVDNLMTVTQPGIAGTTASTTSTLVRDPEDPLGLLLNVSWYGTAGRSTFESWCHSVTTPGGSTAYAYYNIPVLASAGPNKDLGLLSPTMAPDLSTLNVNRDTDNIYSFRLIPPGARGD